MLTKEIKELMDYADILYESWRQEKYYEKFNEYVAHFRFELKRIFGDKARVMLFKPNFHIKLEIEGRKFIIRVTETKVTFKEV